MNAIAHPVDLVQSTVVPGVYCIPLANADGTPIGANLAGEGVTATAAELNYLGGATPGASVASLALVAGAGREIPTGLVENVVTKNADYPLVAGDSGKVVIVTGVDKVLTLPATVAGLRYLIILAAAGLSAGTGLEVRPQAADQIIGNGFTPADDKSAFLAGAVDRAGDLLEVVGDGNLGWYITRVIGTWTREV